MEDIRETGPIGLKGLRGLKGLNQQSQADSDPFAAIRYRGGNAQAIQRLTEIYSNKPVEYVGEELSKAGVGDSQYDKKVSDLWDIENLEDFRAQAQPWYDKLANGLVKMVTTATTTFLDGTFGALVGLSTGIYNLFDDDPETGFWRGMWDNAFTNAMADVSDEMEKRFKNYRTDWENNASVFERMFSGLGAANFWADDIIKNAGFTIGAAASIYATAGLGNLLKGVSWISKAGEGLGLLRKTADGATVATKIGKPAAIVARTFASAQGEATIEALNSIRDNRKLMEDNLSRVEQSRQNEALFEYETALQTGENPEIAKQRYEQKLQNIQRDLNAYRAQMEKEFTDAGNITYLGNILALSVSHHFMLGSLIRGGFNSSESLVKQAIKTAAGKRLNTTQEVGEALLRGNLSLEAPAIKHGTAKVLGRWGLIATQEGIEEGVQNQISTTTQMHTQAVMNKWAKDHTMLGSMINPDMEESYIDYATALSHAWEDQFGKLNGRGWDEVMAGFITGALGVPGMHRNSAGKIRPTWNGGFKEAREQIFGDTKAIQRQVELLNKTLTDAKFNERVKHVVQQMAIRSGQDKAIQDGNILAFKNYEVQQLLSDAVFFKEQGMLDEYLEMLKAMQNVTDEDLKELKLAVKDSKYSTSLEKKSDEELKNIYSEKAKSNLNKVQKALENYEKIEKKYGDRFSDSVKAEALLEMAFQDSLYEDTVRRLNEQREKLNRLNEKQNLSSKEKGEKKEVEAAIKELEKQEKEVKETADKYRKEPEILAKEILDRQAEREKINLYKKAEAAIAKYKDAQTLQDIIDIYKHSPEKERDKVLNQAIEQSEGEVKEKLEIFKNHISDIDTLLWLVTDRFNLDKDGLEEDELYETLENQLRYQGLFNSIFNEILADENPVLTRDNIKKKLQSALDDFKSRIDDLKKASLGVVKTKKGYMLKEAFDSGELELSTDFKRVLIDEKSGKETLEPVTEKAEQAIQAATDLREAEQAIVHLTYFIKSLDKLDDLRKAGKKKKGKTEEEGIQGEPIEIELVSEGEEEKETKEPKEEEEENAIKFPDMFSEEEKKYVEIQVVTGKSGMSYFIVKGKKGVIPPKEIQVSIKNKLINTQGTMEDPMQKYEMAKKNGDTKEMEEELSRLYNAIKSLVFGPKFIMDNVENFFASNPEAIKPISLPKEPKNPKTGNGQITNSAEISLNGNQYAGYVRSELTKSQKMVAVTTQKNGQTPLQAWLNQNGYNIQLIIDGFLNSIIERDSKKKTQERTPIYYLHSNQKDGFDLTSHVFLAMKYSDVEDIIPREIAKTITINGTDYILVGTLGYEKARAGTKEMVEKIHADLTVAEHDNGWAVHNKTNRIKDHTAGSIVKQTLKDKKTETRDLRDLLNDPNRNPYGLKLEDLGWTIIEGKEEAPTRKVINDDESSVYNVITGRPGQVYLHIPASNGMSIPVYVETLFLNELDEDSILYQEIKQLIQTLADTEVSSKDKDAAIAQLRDYLIFSRPNQVHWNNENSKFDANTIYITRNGVPIKIIDFAEEKGTYEDLLEAIKSVNPRINISTTVLSKNPEIYLNSGALRTDIAYLATANSSFYVYPIDKEGNYVENKRHTLTTVTATTSTKERVYLQGKYYYYDGENFTDSKGDIIDDENGMLKIAYEIKQGKHKAITYNKGTYYDVRGIMYSDNGHGGLDVLDNSLREKILKFAAKQSKKVKEEEKKGTKKSSKLYSPNQIAYIHRNKLSEKDKKVLEGLRAISLIPNLKVSITFEKNDNGYLYYVTIPLLQEILGNKSSDIFNLKTIYSQIGSTTSLSSNSDIIPEETQNALSKLVWQTLTEEQISKIINTVQNDLNSSLESIIKTSININIEDISILDLVKLLTMIKTQKISITDGVEQGKQEKKPAKGKRKQAFTNGESIDNEASHEELKTYAELNKLETALKTQRQKTRQLISTIEKKFGIKPNTPEAVIKVLIEHKVPIDTDDIDLLEKLIKNCS